MEILKFKEFNSEKLKCKFEIKIPKMGNLIISGMSYFNNNGKKWVSMPKEKVVINGETKYYSIVRFEDKKTEDIFCEQAMKLIQEKIQTSEPKQSNYEQREIPF